MKTDAEKTKAIREVLQAQTMRPDAVVRADHRAGFEFGKGGYIPPPGQSYYVKDFTTEKYKGTRSMSLDELVKSIKDMETPGNGTVIFQFEGIDVVLDRTNVTVNLTNDAPAPIEPRATKAFAERMQQVVQLGQKLFDLMYRIS